VTTIEQKAVARLECKFDTGDDSDGKMTFTGYGSVFGNVDSYGDVVAAGAFVDSLADHKAAGTSPLMLLNHDAWDQLPIGVWKSMEEDEYGLKVSGELLDTAMGRDTYTALKSGAISGLSIGYRVKAFKVQETQDDPLRTIMKADLVEVSVVTLPANVKACVQAVKSMGAEMTVRDLEALLREVGLSKSESIAVASQFESRKELSEKKAVSDAIASLIGKMRAA
jgi:HK97 family phage prohead protease